MNGWLNRNELAALKLAHTAIWAAVEAAVLYLVWSGVTRRSDRRAAVAGAMVAAESLTFLANGARCPLTLLAESWGDDHGSVTDVYLPRWLAHNLPAIHVPLLALIVWLHARNLRGARGNTRSGRRRRAAGLRAPTAPGSGGPPRCR